MSPMLISKVPMVSQLISGITSSWLGADITVERVKREISSEPPIAAMVIKPAALDCLFTRGLIITEITIKDKTGKRYIHQTN